MKGLIISIFIILNFIYFTIGIIVIDHLNDEPLILFVALYIVFGYATLIILPNWAEEIGR